MTKHWDEEKIADLLSDAFAPQTASRRSRSKDSSSQANIDVLITFDAAGVSSHPNHTSLYHGARAFLRRLLKGKSGGTSNVALYTLTSVNMARKYGWISDVFATMLLWALQGKSPDKAHPGALLFMNGLGGSEGAVLKTGWKAMTEAHASQMRWFRYGWIALSRYMVINDLRLENVKAE